MTNIPEGYELVSGRSGEQARQAIALATERGIPSHEVRSIQEGYLVPVSGEGFDGPGHGSLIYDGDVEDEVLTAQAEKIETPTGSWKNDDIIQFAKDWNIDLGDAKTKPEYLAAIDAEIERRSEEAEKTGVLNDGKAPETNPTQED